MLNTPAPSVLQLAKLGIPFAIREHLIERGSSKDRPSLRETKKRHEEWEALLRSGVTRQEIARRYGVCKSAVSYVLTRRGFRAKLGGKPRGVVVDGKIYRTQEQAFSALKIREAGLQKLILAGRAKYVQRGKNDGAS